MPTGGMGLRRGEMSGSAKDVGSGRKPRTLAKCPGAAEPRHAEAKGTASDRGASRSMGVGRKA